MEMFNKQTKEEKLKSLSNLAKIIDKMPTGVSEDFPVALPPNVRKALEKMRSSLPKEE
jgi:hypothetical protein